jgi:uncharacterized protein YqfB (UPF0267 family)
MGFKLSKLRKKVFKVNKSVGISYDNYENVKSYARKGDILQIINETKSHFVFVAKVDLNNVWCFHAQPLPLNKSTNNGLAFIKYEPLIEILKDIFPDQTLFYRINNQIELSDKVLELTQNSIPNVNEVIALLKPLQNTIVRYNENYCNSEHYVKLWKYGIGWSNDISSMKHILKTIKMFRNSFAKNVYEIEINNQNIVNSDVSLIIYCFGLFGDKLLDGISYIMERQRVLQV